MLPKKSNLRQNAASPTGSAKLGAWDEVENGNTRKEIKTDYAVIVKTTSEAAMSRFDLQKIESVMSRAILKKKQTNKKHNAVEMGQEESN